MIAKTDGCAYNSCMANCFFCGEHIPAQQKIYRNSTCSKCGNPLKICRNCRFYDPSAAHQCTEPVSEPVGNKESANFCEYFVITDKDSSVSETAEEKRRKARDAFDNLFS